MTNESTSTFPLHHFPSHKYDFGDRVYVLPLRASGVVEAIAYRRHDDTWHYRLTALAPATDRWWTQDELKHWDEDRDRHGLSHKNAINPKP